MVGTNDALTCDGLGEPCSKPAGYLVIFSDPKAGGVMRLVTLCETCHKRMIRENGLQPVDLAVNYANTKVGVSDAERVVYAVSTRLHAPAYLKRGCDDERNE